MGNNSKGFTIIEIAVITGLIAILSSVGVLTFQGIQIRKLADLTMDELVADLRDAQQRSITQDRGAKWGVHLVSDSAGPDYYQVFYGDSFAAGTVFKTVYLPPSMHFSSLAPGATDDIIFEKVTGEPDAIQSIIISLIDNPDVSPSVSIPLSGLITPLTSAPQLDISLSLNPSSRTILQGGATNTVVNVSLLAGVPQVSDFSISNLPAGASANFSPVSCTPTCNSTLTILTSPSTPGGTYTLPVKVTSGSIGKTADFTLTVNLPTTPGAPQNPSAAAGNQQIQLSWQAPSFDGGSAITNYKIYRGTSPGGESFLINAGNVLAYTNTGLTNGTTYYYKVAAQNAIGVGNQSSEVSATPATVVPDAPQNLSATAGSGQITLNWQSPVSDGGAVITNYKVYRGTSSGGETFLADAGNVLTYNDTGLTPGTAYYYKIAAQNSVGVGNQSSEISAIPTATAPGVPQSLNAVSGNQQAVLSWQVPASDGGSVITNYKIYRGASSGGETFLADAGNVLTYTNTGLTNGTTYYYKVAAQNAIGVGSQGNEANATPSFGSVVFVTSTFYNGNLGGLSGADAKCQARADAQNLGGYWFAWLSNSTTSASSRLYQDPGPYKSINGSLVANNWTDLTDGTLVSAINITESGATVGGEVWTNTNFNGSITDTNNSRSCLGWTTNSYVFPTWYTGEIGYSGNTNFQWTRWVSQVCSNLYRLYCVKQPPSAPGAPTGASATPNPGQVSLSWTAPSSQGVPALTNYKIYRGIASGGETLLTTLGNVLNYTDTAVNNGTTYYYKVSAVNATGESALSNETSATPNLTAPSVPLSFTAVSANGRNLLKWSAPSSNGGSAITNYKVYRGTTSGGETLLTRLGNVLAYTDTGLTNGTTYYYKVSAVNAIGEGSLSTEASSAPQNIYLTFVTNNAQLTGFGLNGLSGADTICQSSADATTLGGSWKAWLSDSANSPSSRFAKNNSFGYKLTNGTVIANNWADLTDGVIASPINITEFGTAVSAGTGVVLTDTAINGTIASVSANCSNWTANSTNPITGSWNNTDGGWTNYTSGNTCGNFAHLYCFEQDTTTIPSAPLNVSASTGNSEINLTWSAPSSSGGSVITNYKVYRGTASGGETLVTTGGCANLGNVLSCVDTALTNGTTYYYKVSAVNLFGESPQSLETSAVFASAPSAPQNLSASANQGIQLSWSAPISNGGLAVTNYKVYRGTSSGGETFLTTLGNVLNFTDTNINNSNTYYYKVSAVNAAGEGSLSNEVNIAPLSAPQNLSAVAASSRVPLRWTAPSFNAGSAITNYKVYRGTSPGGEILITSGGCANLGNVLSCVDIGLTNGTTYYYKVSAVNSSGEGLLSDEFGAAPQNIALVFLTNNFYFGYFLGGLAGGDAKCQSSADAAVLGGSWKAWLSDSDIAASSRLTHKTVPYKRVDGVLVANNWTDLTDGALANTINVNQYGQTEFSLRPVYTSTNTDGSRTNSFPGQNCSNWNGWTGYPTIGNYNYSSGFWTNYSSFGECGTGSHLYCFEQ